MDLDKALVSALFVEGKNALKIAKERGIQAAFLQGEGKQAYEFLVGYNGSYGDLPSVEMLKGKTGIELDAPDGTAAFFVDEVLDRQLHLTMRKHVAEVITQLEQRKPRDAYDTLTRCLTEVRKEAIAKTSVESIPKLFGEVWTYYERIKSGARGVLTPWNSLNEETLGYWPGDVVLFCSRTGIGKTWLAVLTGYYAWKDEGKRVTFVSPEMSKLRVAMRFAALHCQVSYNDLRKGKLGTFAEQTVKETLDDVAQSDGLYCVGGDFNFSMASLETVMEESKPDLMIVDGAYLLKAEGANRLERAANAFDELKRMAVRYGVPIVVTTQFNREVKSNVASSVQTEKIALTDVASWNSDLIVALVQTEDMRRDKRMIFKTLKGRECVIDEFECQWDFEQMMFGELPKSGGATDFDSGMSLAPSTEDPPF